MAEACRATAANFSTHTFATSGQFFANKMSLKQLCTFVHVVGALSEQAKRYVWPAIESKDHHLAGRGRSHEDRGALAKMSHPFLVPKNN